MTELTDEQKQFLEECEKEFANRYTEDDKDFMQVCNYRAKRHRGHLVLPSIKNN